MKYWRSERARINARGYRGKPDRDRMNKTEADYAGVLLIRQAAGEVLSFGFQRMKLRLANRTWFEPDFDVQLFDGSLELHEVKGFWDEDARIKIKVAADQFPFAFVGVMRSGARGFAFEYFSGSAPVRSRP